MDNCAASMSNPFWAFSLATYEAQGVAAACIHLQDTFGMDVNLLLYGAWLAHENLSPQQEYLHDLDAAVAEWRDRVVRPLRALRRQWADYPPASALREDVKALELRAEREQQAMMYDIHRRRFNTLGRAQGARENLIQIAQLMSPDDRGWLDDIERLAALLAP
jgi:uncharacterized protein (TIGR02444 family)